MRRQTRLDAPDGALQPILRLQRILCGRTTPASAIRLMDASLGCLLLDMLHSSVATKKTLEPAPVVLPYRFRLSRQASTSSTATGYRRFISGSPSSPSKGKHLPAGRSRHEAASFGRILARQNLASRHDGMHLPEEASRHRGASANRMRAEPVTRAGGCNLRPDRKLPVKCLVAGLPDC